MGEYITITGDDLLNRIYDAEAIYGTVNFIPGKASTVELNRVDVLECVSEIIHNTHNAKFVIENLDDKDILSFI